MSPQLTTEEQIVINAQQYIARYGTKRHGQPIQSLMDAVSSVHGYRMGSQYDQGFIHRRFYVERISNNHVVDYDVLISSFWHGVFKRLPDAKVVGAEVMVREAELRPTGTEVVSNIEVSLSHVHGRVYQVRATKMPPIRYLQMQGTTAARKYLTSCYKTRLRQSCASCGLTGSLGVTREFDDGCPKCQSVNSVMVAGVMRRRSRRCADCNHIRLCVMKRICGEPKPSTDGRVTYEWGCGSSDVSVIQAEEFMSDNESWDATLGEDGHDPEVHLLKEELERDAVAFTQACMDTMPRDARDPNGDSQSRKILRILVSPVDGAEICKKCVSSAPQVCSEKCGVTGCQHQTVPDAKVSCGAAQFSMGECINYSKKIGEFLGYTASLANRRVSKVRKHAIEFANKNTRRFATAKYLARRLEDA